MARGRHWTHAEETRIREAAARNWPRLDRLAVAMGRTHAAVRQRASRIGARRLAPAGSGKTRGPAVPTSRTCKYCGSGFSATGVAVHCSEECRTLDGGHCPGCGRVWKPGESCGWCSRASMRSTWPARVSQEPAAVWPG